MKINSQRLHLLIFLYKAFNTPKITSSLKNISIQLKLPLIFYPKGKLHLRARTAINRIQNVMAASGQFP